MRRGRLRIACRHLAAGYKMSGRLFWACRSASVKLLCGRLAAFSARQRSFKVNSALSLASVAKTGLWRAACAPLEQAEHQSNTGQYAVAAFI